MVVEPTPLWTLAGPWQGPASRQTSLLPLGPSRFPVTSDMEQMREFRTLPVTTMRIAFFFQEKKKGQLVCARRTVRGRDDQAQVLPPTYQRNTDGIILLAHCQ